MHVLAQLLSYLHVITSKKRLPLCIFFSWKTSQRFIEEFYYNALGAFFDALIQRTDGCHGCWCSLTTAFTVLINGT